MFTAIVLDSDSQNALIAKALAIGALTPGHPAKCHHVTLAMGNASDRFNVGEVRRLTVTHFGRVAGRVSAFRVSGADDSRNSVPHVTVAVYGDAKPKESNLISAWVPVIPFDISGTVEVCG